MSLDGVSDSLFANLVVAVVDTLETEVCVDTEVEEVEERLGENLDRDTGICLVGNGIEGTGLEGTGLEGTGLEGTGIEGIGRRY